MNISYHLELLIYHWLICMYVCVCSNANWYDQSHNHNYLRLQQQSNESMHTSNLNQIIEFLKCRQYHPIKSNEMLHLNSIFSSIYFELLIYEFFFVFGVTYIRTYTNYPNVDCCVWA